MKMLKKSAAWIVIVLALCFLSVACVGLLNKKLGLEDDNLMEEAMEELIEYQTGLDIDLTPDTNERVY